jgi:hypothetical protein
MKEVLRDLPQSRRFADLDAVSFRVTDFEEFRAADFLDWAWRGVSDAQIFVGLLHVGAKHYGWSFWRLYPARSISFLSLSKTVGCSAPGSFSATSDGSGQSQSTGTFVSLQSKATIHHCFSA